MQWSSSKQSKSLEVTVRVLCGCARQFSNAQVAGLGLTQPTRGIRFDIRCHAETLGRQMTAMSAFVFADRMTSIRPK